MSVKKVDILRRYGFIETRLYWGGGVTADALARAFGLTRQAAQATINAYKDAHASNIQTNRRTRQQELGPDFSAAYISAGSNRFLDYVRGQSLVGRYVEDSDWSELSCCDVGLYARPRLKDTHVRALILALYRQQTVDVYYQSKKQRQHWIVSPNHLVFADNRYHMRCYAHEVQRYLDLVLTRFLQVDACPEAWVSDYGDGEWHASETLYFTPNPDLPAETRAALALDFDLDDKQCYPIRCPKALSHYVKRQMMRLVPESGLSLWRLLDEALCTPLHGR